MNILVLITQVLNMMKKISCTESELLTVLVGCGFITPEDVVNNSFLDNLFYVALNKSVQFQKFVSIWNAELETEF